MEKLKNTKSGSQDRKRSGAGRKARGAGRRNEPGDRGGRRTGRGGPLTRCLAFARATPEFIAAKAPGSQEFVCKGLRKDGKPVTGRQGCQETSSTHLKERRKTVAGGDWKSKRVSFFFSFSLFHFKSYFFFFWTICLSLQADGKEPAGEAEATADKE